MTDYYFKEFPTLYHLDDNGNIRIWRMQLQGDHYRTISGIENGQLVYSDWTYAKPKNISKKNETSAEQQAELEVCAQYKKKLERKYHEKREDVIKGSHYFEPMLAQKYNGIDWLHTGPIYTQAKLDGARCIATKHGLFSRQGKKYVSVPHIENALKPFFEEYPDVTLDGEWYNHELRNDFNTIMSIIRKTKPTKEDIALAEKYIQYHIYDIVSDVIFGIRYGNLRDMIADGYESEYLQLVDTYECKTQEKLDEMYAMFMEQGYEGQMIRLNGPYEIGKRSKYLLKRKEFIDEEFKVVRLEEGRGNWSGVYKVCVCLNKNGEEFGAGIKGSQEYTASLLNKPCPTLATIRYQNMTPDGKPRFPIAVNFFWGERDI